MTRLTLYAVKGGDRREVDPDSIAWSRQKAIEQFCQGRSRDWTYWKLGHGYRTVKLECTVKK